MVAKKSHGKANAWIGKRGFRNLCVILAVTLPMCLAIRGAWILGSRAIAQQNIEIEHMKTQEIRAQSRSLSDDIFSEIDAIKIRATAIASLNHFQLGVTDLSILAVAEVGNGNQIIKVVSDYQNTNAPKTVSKKKPVLDPLLYNAISSTIPLISAKQIDDTGVSLVSVHNWIQNSAPSHNTVNPLAIAFKHPEGSTPADHHYLVAIVNPVEAFKGISRWSNGKDGEMLRGFLIDSTGKVIVHSEKIYNGSNFANHALFRQALAPTFKGERVGGTGVFPAADTLSTRVSYSQLRSLPYVVVAERVLHSGSPLYSLQLFKNLASPALFIGLVLVLSCIGSVMLVFRAFASTAASAPIFLSPQLDKELSDFSELHELTQEKKRLENAIKAMRARGEDRVSSDEAPRSAANTTVQTVQEIFEKQLQAAQNKVDHADSSKPKSELPS